jgi:hypothetical protein
MWLWRLRNTNHSQQDQDQHRLSVTVPRAKGRSLQESRKYGGRPLTNYRAVPGAGEVIGCGFPLAEKIPRKIKSLFKAKQRIWTSTVSEQAHQSMPEKLVVALRPKGNSA